MQSEYTVLLFYKYVTVADPGALANWIQQEAHNKNLTGRVLVADEGINGTLEGLHKDAEAFAELFLADPRFSDVSVKQSEGTGSAFPKLSVKVRREIVGTQFQKEDADPERKTAPRVSPEELKCLITEDENLVIVDMRNDYEYKAGHFKGSVHPGLVASRDLPDKLHLLEPYKEKKVVTVCTGGIRCEKMSAYLLSNGFSDVYQLEDGIHAYMQRYPGEDFLGALYTFDTRKTMHFGGSREVVGTCYLCSEKTEHYTNCGNDFCHLHFLVCTACMGDERTFCGDVCRELVAAKR